MQDILPRDAATIWETALDGLSPDERGRIHERLSERLHDAHSCIFHPGEQSTALYIVKRGELRLYYLNEAGKEFTLGICSAGHMIGLLSALLNRARFIFAESKFSVVLHVLARDALLELMESIPRFSLNISVIVAKMAAHHMSSYGMFAVEPASVRLANILLRMAIPRGDARTEGGSGGPYLVVGLTQSELANLIGVSRTWVNQILADFERQGMIRRQRQGILIPDLDALFRKRTEFKALSERTGS